MGNVRDTVNPKRLTKDAFTLSKGERENMIVFRRILTNYNIVVHIQKRQISKKNFASAKCERTLTVRLRALCKS